ncbi:lymphokine-activated killer T-cell-originated protein kinase [Sceloporus undulatus]|uniref:lymphokine-activated killer T-cell-originated protein kinase n=1 Tax=Sceloporus undulatus TaxID=8520 RepID=UPI001C4DC047|nr:lymphokine-activated killer T-cell-originated protein kinase [Sceloporus undulatus]XP_042305142.1 lymphokine-activated killer T-cell-originated protein kinase [Sceloporus undulatus]XP_042305151.1 lymphokine-activated killer T-cell-originated protein kinase [Sceloporus undulatus]
MASGPAFKTPSKPSERRRSGQGSPSPSVTIPASPFMQKLGYGTGVSVYLMKRSPKGASRSPWAVKKINPQCDSSQRSTYQKRLNDEATILRHLKHPNIVGYRAFTEAKDGSMCLAMEYGGEKSLNDLIEERQANHQGPFPASTILRVALHMARGLKYLHNEKKLLHGDIKSCNVVIKGDFESIKICDVGVSLPLDENMMVSDPEAVYIGTEPWKPKEALEEGGVITDKADIFALGLTLWEMMTLSVPHVNLLGDADDLDEDASFDEDDFDEDAYYAALGSRPPLNMEALGPSYQKAIELFVLCTMEDARKRPPAAHIVAVLESDGAVQ